ncbi:MAG: type II toxin-antitoxin system RelB/DinJ family antitoxin [Roseburia sp.]
MITVSLRFDEQMKQELDQICEAMGMNLTTFFTIYAKKVIRDRKIPFVIEAPSTVDAVETALDEADKYAEEDMTRMSHEEVFAGLRRRVNG